MKMNIANVKSSRKFLAALFVAMLALVCVAGAATMYENTEVNAAATDIQHVSGTLSADATYAGVVQIDAGATLTVPAGVTMTVGVSTVEETVFTVYGTLILKEGSGLLIEATSDNTLQLAENGKIEITTKLSDLGDPEAASEDPEAASEDPAVKIVISVADLKSKEFVGIEAEVVANTVAEEEEVDTVVSGYLVDNEVIVTVTASALSQGTITLDAPSTVVFVADEMTDLGAATEIIVKGGATLSTQEDDVETAEVNESSILTTAGKITVTKGTLAGVIESSGEVYISSTSVFLAELTLDGYTGVFNAASGATLSGTVKAWSNETLSVESSVGFAGVKAASAVSVVFVDKTVDYLLISGSVKNFNSAATEVGGSSVTLNGNVSIAETLSIQKFVEIEIEITGTLTVLADAYLNIEKDAGLTVSSDDTLIVEGTVNIAEGADHGGAGVEVKGDGVIISVSDALDFGDFKAVEYAIQTGTATEPVITYYYVTFANAVVMIPEAVDNTITLKGDVELSEDVDCTIPAEATVEFGAFDLTVKDDASLIVEEGAAVAPEKILSETEYVTGEVTVYAGIYKALDDAPEGSIIELKKAVTVTRNIVLADGQTLNIDTVALTIGNAKKVTFTVYGDIEVTFADGLTISAGSGLIMDGGAIVAISIDNDGTIDVISGSIETATAITYNEGINSALYYKDADGVMKYVYTDIVSALAAEDMWSFAGVLGSGDSGITGFEYIVSVLGDIEFVTITVPADVGLLVGAYLVPEENPVEVGASLVADVTLLSDSENETLSVIVFMGESSFIGDVVMDLYCGVATSGTNAEILGVFEYGENNVIVSGTYDGQIVAADEKYDGFGVYGDEVNFKGLPAGIVVSGELTDGLVTAEGNISLWLEIFNDAMFSMESGALYVLDLFLYGEDASAYLGTPATSLSAAALVIYGVQSGEGIGKITPGTGIVMIYADAEFGKAVSGTDIIGGSVASEAKKMVFMIGDDVYVTEYSNSGNAVLVVPQIDGYSFVGWYKNPDQTEIFSANNHAVFGDIFESYGFIEVATFQVTFQYAEGVEYYVDGSLVSGPVYLSVGAHSFTVKVLDGYSGTPVAKTSGSVSVASGTLTVSGDGQITGVTGVTKDQPAAAGMSLTDILMIVLVIVVVILAIVVVMRLMRS